MQGKPRTNRAEVVAQHYREGLSVKESAQLLGLATTTVASHRKAARTRGLIPTKKPKARQIFKHNTIGNFTKAVREMDPDVALWIRKQIPEGGSVVEFAIACLVDLYHEETGQ